MGITKETVIVIVSISNIAFTITINFWSFYSVEITLIRRALKIDDDGGNAGLGLEEAIALSVNAFTRFSYCFSVKSNIPSLLDSSYLLALLLLCVFIVLLLLHHRHDEEDANCFIVSIAFLIEAGTLSVFPSITGLM
jgi:hypothetical protein